MSGFLGIFIQLRGTEYSLGLWFLPLLFISEIFVYIIICRKSIIQWIVVIPFYFAGYLYANLLHTSLPWAIDAVPFAAFYVWIGYWYKNIVSIATPINGLKKIHDFLPHLAIIGSMLLNILFGRLNVVCAGQSVDMHKMIYGNLLLYTIAGISGVLFVLLICQLFFDKHKVDILSDIGKNTLHIYCLHGLVLGVIKKGIEIIAGKDEFQCSSIFQQVFIAVIVLSVCMLIIKVFDLIKQKAISRVID